MGSFEQGFGDVERSANAAARATSGLMTIVRQVRRAAEHGDIAAMRRSSDRLLAALETVRQELANTREAWPFADDDEEAYLQDGYEQELVEAAAAAGLRVSAQDGRLLAYPSVLRVTPAERSVRVDRKRVTAIRPSYLAAQLKAAQSKKPRFSAERFVESLYRAYRQIVGADGIGRSVALLEVYDLLTLLPGAANEYSRTDFARDMFALDTSGIDTTRAGLRVSLPASTGTRSAKGVLTFVAPDGGLRTYYAVRFESLG